MASRKEQLEEKFKDLQALQVFSDFDWEDWTLVVDKNMKPRYEGVCQLDRKQIKIHLRREVPIQQLFETLVHEMAHAVLGEGGHGPLFLRTVLTASYQAGIVSKPLALELNTQSYREVEAVLNRAWRDHL
jgi:hypothetical protein